MMDQDGRGSKKKQELNQKRQEKEMAKMSKISHVTTRQAHKENEDAAQDFRQSKEDAVANAQADAAQPDN